MCSLPLEPPSVGIFLISFFPLDYFYKLFMKKDICGPLSIILIELISLRCYHSLNFRQSVS